MTDPNLRTLLVAKLARLADRLTALQDECAAGLGKLEG